MGIRDSFIAMIGDFVESKRNPEFRSKTDLTIPSKIADSTERPNGRRNRRHSLSITVGTEAEPEATVRQRTFSVRNLPSRRNTITPEVKEPPSTPIDRRMPKERRASEPFNAKPPELRLYRSPRSPQPPETDSESSNPTTPATSPRLFQNNYEKRNKHFFGPSSWRASAFLDEQPIVEEGEEEEPNRKITVIRIPN